MAKFDSAVSFTLQVQKNFFFNVWIFSMLSVPFSSVTRWIIILLVIYLTSKLLSYTLTEPVVTFS